MVWGEAGGGGQNPDSVTWSSPWHSVLFFCVQTARGIEVGSEGFGPLVCCPLPCSTVEVMVEGSRILETDSPAPQVLCTFDRTTKHTCWTPAPAPSPLRPDDIVRSPVGCRGVVLSASAASTVTTAQETLFGSRVSRRRASQLAECRRESMHAKTEHDRPAPRPSGYGASVMRQSNDAGRGCA